MPTLPIRTLGAVGVICDASPYDLPLNAFSKAVNVVFDEGRAQRAPVFKTLYAAIRNPMPFGDDADTFASASGSFENTVGGISYSQRFIGSYANGYNESVLVCDVDGTVREYLNGDLRIITPGTTNPVTNNYAWTHAQAAGVSILARRGMRPYARNLDTEQSYGELRNDWPTDYSCAVMRTYNDFFIALNVTKGTKECPTLVKWCHPMQYSPNLNTGITWATDDPTKLSGENPIGEMKTPLRDGVSLGRSFILYSQDQVWVMDYTGSADVFNFRKVFSTGGIIATNCAVEIEAKHYVFGEDDIYVHDGVTMKSIADERVRKRVFQDIDRDKRDSFFVHHDSNLNLLYFAYVTKDTDVAFPGTPYCNMAAVYNYRNNTWTFMDMPNIVGGAETNISLQQAGFATDSQTQTPRVSVMLGVALPTKGLSESRVYAVDTPEVGVVALQPNPETIKPAILERIGIDLDKEASYSIRAYKTIKAILPQVVFNGPTGQLSFQIGASDFIGGPITWQDPVPFDHVNDYRVDTRASGRYLALRVTSPTADLFKFVGFDIDTIKTGKR